MKTLLVLTVFLALSGCGDGVLLPDCRSACDDEFQAAIITERDMWRLLRLQCDTPACLEDVDMEHRIIEEGILMELEICRRECWE